VTEQAQAEEATTLRLTSDEALVFFSILSRWSDENATRADHAAEQTVLDGILATLEEQLTAPFAPDYEQLVQAARDRLMRQ
jgi:hypothetical protein